MIPVGTLLSLPVISLQQMLQKEAVERQRQEHKARRLRGALRHLLADAETLECPDANPATDRMPEERTAHEIDLESLCRNSSLGPSEHCGDGPIIDRGIVNRPGDNGDVIDLGLQIPRTTELRGSLELTGQLGQEIAWG